MRFNMKFRSGIHPVPLCFVSCAALFGANFATAADPAATTVNANGLMTFPHVRVINMPAPAATAVPAAAQPGLRAYIDPATGALRGPTQEELVQQNIEDQMLRQLQQQQFGSPANQEIPSASGIGMRLDESSMMYSVVQKSADGSLQEFCVAGPEQAAKLMNFIAPASTALNRKGAFNVR